MVYFRARGVGGFVSLWYIENWRARLLPRRMRFREEIICYFTDFEFALIWRWRALAFVLSAILIFHTRLILAVYLHACGLGRVLLQEENYTSLSREDVFSTTPLWDADYVIGLALVFKGCDASLHWMLSTAWHYCPDLLPPAGLIWLILSLLYEQWIISRRFRHFAYQMSKYISSSRRYEKMAFFAKLWRCHWFKWWASSAMISRGWWWMILDLIHFCVRSVFKRALMLRFCHALWRFYIKVLLCWLWWDALNFEQLIHRLYKLLNLAVRWFCHTLYAAII